MATCVDVIVNSVRRVVTPLVVELKRRDAALCPSCCQIASPQLNVMNFSFAARASNGVRDKLSLTILLIVS